jgi:hypothetical protein
MQMLLHKGTQRIARLRYGYGGQGKAAGIQSFYHSIIQSLIMAGKAKKSRQSFSHLKSEIEPN